MRGGCGRGAPSTSYRLESPVGRSHEFNDPLWCLTLKPIEICPFTSGSPLWGSGVRSHREAIFRIFRKSRGQERNHRAAIFRIFANHGGRRGVIGRRFPGFRASRGQERPRPGICSSRARNAMGLAYGLLPQSPPRRSPLWSKVGRGCARFDS